MRAFGLTGDGSMISLLAKSLMLALSWPEGIALDSPPALRPE
jgi:hypothetical protein